MNFPIYDCKTVGFIKPSNILEAFHDKALEKASEKPYNPPKKLINNAKKTIFLANLNRKTTVDKITDEFKRFGSILSVKLIKDLITNESKGYCFVEFKHFSDAFEAYKRAQGILLENQRIIVDFERERRQKDWKPRRKGGGLGGRKNSGQMRFSQKIYKKH